MPTDPIKIMFVCLGNICRSPLAEGLFREKVRAAGLEDRFEIASSGTGNWHVGEPPDDRMTQTAAAQGIALDEQRAQQFAADDLAGYDHVFVMDKSNLHDVLHLDREEQHAGKVRLFREFDPEPGDYQVPDPYQGGRQGFEKVFSIADRTTETILQRLIEEHDLSGEGGRGKREGVREAVPVRRVPSFLLALPYAPTPIHPHPTAWISPERFRRRCARISAKPWKAARRWAAAAWQTPAGWRQAGGTTF